MSSAPQKVALVTGAARGIGLAVAKKFLAEDWRVALLDIEGELLWNTVEALASAGNTLGLHCDVSDASAVASALAEVERRFGRLDASGQQRRSCGVRPVAGDTSDATGGGCWKSI